MQLSFCLPLLSSCVSKGQSLVTPLSSGGAFLCNRISSHKPATPARYQSAKFSSEPTSIPAYLAAIYSLYIPRKAQARAHPA